MIRCAIEQRVGGVILKSYPPADPGGDRLYRDGADGHARRLAAGACPRGEASRLSPRQRQILALIAQGRGNEEIAA